MQGTIAAGLDAALTDLGTQCETVCLLGNLLSDNWASTCQVRQSLIGICKICNAKFCSRVLHGYIIGCCMGT